MNKIAEVIDLKEGIAYARHSNNCVQARALYVGKISGPQKWVQTASGLTHRYATLGDWQMVSRLSELMQTPVPKTYRTFKSTSGSNKGIEYRVVDGLIEYRLGNNPLNRWASLGEADSSSLIERLRKYNNWEAIKGIADLFLNPTEEPQ